MTNKIKYSNYWNAWTKPCKRMIMYVCVRGIEFNCCCDISYSGILELFQHWERLTILNPFLENRAKMYAIYIHCWVRLLSNYNIKYICTIYTRLNTCLMSISRLSLRDKVTLRLLKLYFYITDVVESSRALDIKLSDLCCSVSMVWVQIPSREEQKFVRSKI
jgi:hypothetical protein